MDKEQKYKIRNHEYLKELHGKIPYPFSKKGYPVFREEDTYSLSDTMLDYLYERLRYFQDEVSQHVDLDCDLNEIKINEQTFTLSQCIDRMVGDIGEIVSSISDSNAAYQGLRDSWDRHEISDYEFMKKVSDSMKESPEEKRKIAATKDLFLILSECIWHLWW